MVLHGFIWNHLQLLQCSLRSAFIKGIQTVEQCHELRVRDIAFLVLVGVDEECLEHFLLAEKTIRAFR